MSATFRTRIFRLLLLFAAVPSVILTVLGYYLATETAPVGDPARPERSDQLQSYFIDILYDDINQTLARNETGDLAAGEGLDFAIRFDSAWQIVPPVLGSLPDEATEVLREAVRRQERGLVAIGPAFYQYVTRRTLSGDYSVGGVVHDSTLAALLEGARVSSATRAAERELHSTYIAFLGILFLTVTLIAIVGAYVFSSRVSHRLAEPVVALSRAAGRIAAGDFKQEVTVSAQDELGTLVASFNQMAAELDRTTARLTQTERVAAWRQVARRFAHELKNPLQPILVSLYRIEQQMAGTSEWARIQEPIRAAGEEVKHLTALAERFSSLAKLPPPRLETTDLRSLIGSVLELYIEKLKPFTFNVSVPDDPVVVMSDQAYLREALHNLLQNACDACRPGDRITVSLQCGRDTAEIVVADTGPGMDSTTLASARLPYFTTKPQGNGLGLAIVEKSMAELGGQLKVESTANQGTTVTIALPKGESGCRPES